MTDEREAMTLEQRVHKILNDALGAGYMVDTSIDLDTLREIDAHLSRAAEPVYQHRLRIGSPNRRWFDCSKEEYEAMERNEHDRANFERRILYAQPPESARDAKDSARLDRLSDRYMQASLEADRELGLPSGMCSLREAIDAAMAQESGDE